MANFKSGAFFSWGLSFTYQISTSAHNQQQCVTALAHFAYRLREAIGKLENERKHTSDILNDNDITELRLLARQINAKAVDLAIQAAMHLLRMDKLSQLAESKGDLLQNVSAWGKAHSDCERALDELERVCASIASIDIKSIPPPA